MRIKLRLLFFFSILCAHPLVLPGQVLPTPSPSQKPASTLAPSAHGPLLEQGPLDRAIYGLASLESLSARIRFTADVLNHEFVGSGEYLQLGIGAGRRFRWELRLSVGDRVATLVHVGTPLDLWLYDELPSSRLRRVDLRRLRNQEERAATTAGDSFSPLAEPGGLGGFLETLRKNFSFHESGARRYKELDVVELRGQWRAERLAEIFASLGMDVPQTPETPLDKLPAHVPHESVLLLGRDDYFPYVVEYSRTGSDGGPRRLVTVEWFDVRFNGTIDEAVFHYVPQMEIEDITNEYEAPKQPK
jgi:hypothetical protein